MNNENDDFNLESMDDNIDPELKAAAENFFKVLQNKTDQEAQRAIERWSTEDLKARILQQAVQRVQASAGNLVAAIAVLKILKDVDDSVISSLIQDHCELQVKILKRYEIDMPDVEAATKTLVDSENEGIQGFIKEHSGAHPGCMLDEYQKRVADENSWPDDIEVIG